MSKFRLKQTIGRHDIHNTKLWIGMLLGVFSAGLFYAFLDLVFGSDIIINLGKHLPSNILLSHTQYQCVRVFFATQAILLGHIVWISYVFSRPISKLRNQKYRKRITSDLAFLSGQSYHLILMLFFLFGGFAISAFSIVVHPKQMFWFTGLFGVVLYLDTIKNVVRCLPNRWLWWLYYPLILMGCIALLSQVKILNLNTIRAVVEKNNPRITLPHSTYESSEMRWLSYDVIMKLSTRDGDSKLFIEGHGEVALSEVTSILFQEREMMRPELYSVSNIILEIDAHTKIETVKLLEFKLLLSRHSRVLYRVYDHSKPETRFDEGWLFYRVNPSLLGVYKELEAVNLPPLPPVGFEEHPKTQDSLIVQVHKSYPNLKKYLQPHINAHTSIIYEYNSQTTFQDYINVLSAHKALVSQLRHEHQQVPMTSEINYLSSLDSLRAAYEADQKRLKSTFPFRVQERYKSDH